MADDLERNRLSARTRRYARVSANVGGIAARAIGEHVFGVSGNRRDNAVAMKLALGGLKGPVMKVAQMLATIPEALPTEYAQELLQLQMNAPSMGWPFVRRRMMAELGADWESKFAQFDRTASAAASLGQVHKARLASGEVLACKLQYPDMRSAVEADLAQLRLIFAVHKRLDGAIDTSNMQTEIAERLREELDYQLEARHIALYTEMLGDEPGIQVPELFPQLSTGRLLSMQWLEGKPLLDFVKHPLEVRNMIARHLFAAWWKPFALFGAIHGDPHLGNYSIREDFGVNLLDYGCIRTFRPEFVGGVADLYHALLNDDRAQAVHAYETWGFSGLSNELIDTLNIWARFIYRPMLDDRVRSIADGVAPGDYGRAEAQMVRKELKRLGPVKPPREFVFMDRAAIGLGAVFLHLAAELNWQKLFGDVLQQFDLAALAKRQRAAFTRAGVPLP